MKHTLLIFGLLWALGASGQIYIDSYRFGAAPSANLLLDDYPNAAAAYSLRLLRTAYTGDCIVVRRSSNNDTLAIGFSGNYLDTAALKTFCSGTNCFVRRWYDQSGNAFDVFQNTDANQPQIVTSGVINVMGAAPAIRFNGSSTGLQSNVIISYTGVITAFAVYNYINPNPQFPYIFDHGTQRYILRPISGVQNIFETVNLAGNAYVSGAPYISYAFFNGANSVFTINNTSFTGSTGLLTSASTQITVGRDRNFSSLSPLNGNIQEFVTYRSNQSANQADIRANINSFYNVY